MKPILIASPRTGSTIIGKQIGDLAEQWWGYKNYLYEYFSIGKFFKSEAVIVDGVLHNKIIGPTTEFWADPEQERLHRLKLIGNDYNYMIKLMPFNFDSWTVDWVKGHWNPVFLERRNKLDQLLSYFAFRTSNISHYAKESTAVVDEIDYKWEWAADFLAEMTQYNKIKSQLAGPTIYYEDWLEAGADQQAVIKLLNWPDATYVPMPEMGKLTPYTNIPEYLIRNKTDWNLDKTVIISRLDGIEL